MAERQQLSLPFVERPGYSAADFLAAPSNALARNWLEHPVDWINGRLVLWGEAGVGKTHLLHIWAAVNHASILPAAHLRGLAAPPSSPLAVDDIDNAPDEAALLHLLNIATEAGQPVLLTARHPPARQAQHLPDLTSRLRASLAVQIQPPEDELLAALLAHLAAGRQLVLGLAVQNYLLSRLPRTPAALREAVARLDHAALNRGIRITRTLAAELLADLASPED